MKHSDFIKCKVCGGECTVDDCNSIARKTCPHCVNGYEPVTISHDIDVPDGYTLRIPDDEHYFIYKKYHNGQTIKYHKLPNPIGTVLELNGNPKLTVILESVSWNGKLNERWCVR